jgi:hypothetical protein
MYDIPEYDPHISMDAAPTGCILHEDERDCEEGLCY